MADATGDHDQSSNDEVSLLARLLGDATLRRRFAGDSQQVAQELTDDSASIEFLMRLDHLQLESQAETLVVKRRHEVADFLPLTWHRLGTSAAALFETYAVESAWPKGHDRHLKDAEAFGSWLLDRAKGEAVMTEFHRIRFLLSTHRLAVQIVRGGMIGFRIQILFRHRSGQMRELILGS
jgi:hypothetical protein